MALDPLLDEDPFLPSEPEILVARMGFPDAQSELAGTVVERKSGLFGLGWYHTSVSREVGSFGLVNVSGALSDLIGERLKLTHDGRSVYVYIFGSDDLDYDIHITRRAFAALELLAVERIDAIVEIVNG